MTRAEKPDVLIVSVKLVSGAFESSVRIPLDAAQGVKDRAIQQWLEMIQFGIKMGVTELTADLPSEDKP